MPAWRQSGCPGVTASTNIQEGTAMSILSWPADPEGLTQYLRTIHAYPMLSAEEELALSRAWRDTQDPAAAHKLVTSHLRLVARIALGYRGYGLPLGELISEGNIGMLRALRGFDPERGFRLATYAMWWIKAAIQEYILHSSSLVKMGTTVAQKKLFFNLRRLKSQMHVFDDGDLQPDQVAQVMQTLGVPEYDVISMNRRLSAPDHSLNVAVHQDDDDQWQDRLVDETSNQETEFAEREELADRRTLLGQTFDLLNKREQHILTERWLKDDPTTLDKLAAQYSVSRERVRQIETRALTKLQKAVKARMAARVVGTGPVGAGLSAAA
jgi:RNA polymerase sigma-32 factor